MPGIMFFLGGIATGAVVLVVLYHRWIIWYVHEVYHMILEDFITWRVTSTKQLIVESKFEVPAGSCSTAIDLWLDSRTHVGLISNKYPKQDMWVVGVPIKLIGPLYFQTMSVAVDKETYTRVALGDKLDNPHFGKIDPKAWVDPRVITAHNTRPQ